MNLRDLEYVEAVGKHLSFSRAALACNVSQPALSNQIKKLEQELGATLFDRRAHEIRPTELGHKVIECARTVLVQTQLIRDMALEYKGPTSTPLKIGMTPTLAPYLMQYLGSILNSFFPSMKVTLVENTPDQLAKLIEEHDLDIALIPRHCHSSKLDFSPLFEEPLFLAVRQGHELSARSSINPKDIPIEKFIRLRVPFGFEAEDKMNTPQNILGRGTDFDMSAVRFETVCRHVCNSDNCTFVPALAAEQFKRDGWKLSFLELEEKGHIREIGVISRAGCPRRKMLDVIYNEIYETPPRGVQPIKQGEQDLEKANLAQVL